MGFRSEHIARSMSMGENQNTPVANLPGDITSVFCPLEGLPAASWCFGNNQLRRRSEGRGNRCIAHDGNLEIAGSETAPRTALRNGISCFSSECQRPSLTTFA